LFEELDDEEEPDDLLELTCPLLETLLVTPPVVTLTVLPVIRAIFFARLSPLLCASLDFLL